MKPTTRITIFLTGLIGMLTAIPSFSAIDEMIVTSEHREENLQDVPIAVSAMDVEQMDKLQINEARNLQRYVPSLNMFNNITHPSNLSLSLRGGLQQDASLVVAESPVGIYVDDIYVGRLNSNNATMSDIERVEVLRGPQGTLYGRNTGYGAIRFISRTPGEDQWLNASVGMGNDDQLLLKSSVGGPLGEDWAGSLAAQWKEKDGQYFNFATNSETGKEENLTLRGKIRFMGRDNFDGLLSVAFSDSSNDSNQLVNATTPGIPGSCQDPSVMDPVTGTCPAGVTTTFTYDDLVFTNGPRGVSSPTWPKSPEPLKDKPQADTEQTIVGLTLTWDLTDKLSLKSITGYVGLDGNFMTDFGGNGAFNGGSETNSDQITQEFRLVGSALNDKLNFVTGVFYLNEESDQLWGWNLFGGFISSQSTIDIETDSMSVFGEASYNITDALKLTAGLRYTEDDKDFDFTFRSLSGPVPPQPGPLLPFSESQKPDDWTPKLGIDYIFETDGALDNMLLYATYAEGFKGGGWSAISIGSPVHEIYTEETNKTTEFGLKAEWFDNRLRTNLAYYVSKIKDIQQNSTVTPAGGGSPSFPVQNSGDVDLQGLEFEITAVPIDGLNLFLSGTAFTDGDYKGHRSECGPLATQPSDCSSAERAPYVFGVSEASVPQTPDFTYSIGFDYTLDVPFGNLSFGLDYYEIDDYTTSATNDGFNTGWDSLNGFIAASVGDNWELKLTGKNLTDEDNFTTGSRSLGGFINMAPVEYMFTATYQL